MSFCGAPSDDVGTDVLCSYNRVYGAGSQACATHGQAQQSTHVCGPVLLASSSLTRLFHTSVGAAVDPPVPPDEPDSGSVASTAPDQRATAVSGGAPATTDAAAEEAAASVTDDEQMAFFGDSSQSFAQESFAEHDIAIMDIAGSRPAQPDLVAKYLSPVC